MFAYELQQARRADLQSRADAWRLARDAKAARTSDRRTRRSADRTDASADSASGSSASPRPTRGRVRHAHRAA
ncbi:hypothetical protein ABZ901_11185 [Actinacidiphila alni]|uniref:hypothetical protein n=1 Tax=Actinacidiphila alni TaxID=380248 RepID=UPI0033DCCA69